MNERIRELAKQCTSWSEGSTWTSREVFDKEKFAELLIRECIFAVEDAGGIDKYHYTKAISRHFGVEE